MTGPGEPPGAEPSTLASWLTADRRAVVIFDDDPTGSQSASDVEVLLQLGRKELSRFLGSGERSCYVLTNSRALSREDAAGLIARLADDARAAARAANRQVAFILRGDSTLRGHVFAEIDVMTEPGSVVLFVPAFPEGGRATVDGKHYLEQNGPLTLVSETEFAKDPTFGFTSSRLDEWVSEVGGSGRRTCLVPLNALRREGPPAVTSALQTAPSDAIVIPDAVSETDVRAIVIGLLEAERRGVSVTVRSAATLAALRAGARSPGLLPGPVTSSGPVLIVCGSHTGASTRQLGALQRHLGPPVLLPSDAAIGEPATAGGEAAAVLREQLRERGVAVLATERHRRAEHSGLDYGARVMSAIVGAVASVAEICGGVIAKGGITSAEVATVAFGARSARVRGQLLAGVSLWDLELSKRRLPYAVVPGNVGDDDTLVTLAGRFGLFD